MVHSVHNVHSVCKCCIKFRFGESVWRFMLKLKSLCGGRKRIFQKSGRECADFAKILLLDGGEGGLVVRDNKNSKNCAL